MYKLDSNKLDDFLQTLSRGRIVFALETIRADGSTRPAILAGDKPIEKTQDQYHLVRAETWQPGQHSLGAFRPVEPLKAVVFAPRAVMGQLGTPSPAPNIPEQIVFGVKNCDLSALQIHDHVFLNSEPVDPFYAETRKKTIMVACDCSAACDVCFCPAVNEQPYAKSGFDINISPTALGYVIESGSERGAQLLKQAENLLAPADDEILKERDQNRQKIYRHVCQLAEKSGLVCGADFRQAVEKSRGKSNWDEFAMDCVECGACNFICCTCHCFLLADGKTSNNATTRIRQWDSCLYRNFATVAGGANPRRHRAERLYNRFEKKFSFFPEILGRYACDGCGRCIEACTGKIDIRRVLMRAVNEP